MSRGNPVSAEILQISSESESLPKDIDKLVTQIKEVDTDMTGWLKRQQNLVKLRVGERPRAKGPWKGSSNISIPLTDGLIRRWKPGITSLIFDAENVGSFMAQGPEDMPHTDEAQHFFTWLYREHMDTTFDVVRLADTIAWHGHAYTREGWDYRTQRSARVLEVDRLFPDGVRQTLDTIKQAQMEQNGETLEDEEIIIEILSDEYDMDQDDPQDEAVLMEASDLILQDAEYVKLTFRRVVCDKPSWKVINPVNVIVPQDQDPEKAEFFTIIHDFCEDEMRALGVDGHLERGRVEEFIGESQKTMNATGDAGGENMRDEIRQILNRRANSTQPRHANKVDKFRVWEIYCNLDIERTGERSRCVLWYAPGTDTILGLLDFVYPFDTWPITYYPFEAAGRPIDNRGIADMAQTFQKLVNAYHNQRIDAAQIMLAPVLQKKIMSGGYKNAIKWQPGAIIPVLSTGDIQPIVQDLRILAALTQEEQSSQRLAESYVGVFDSSLTNMNESRERRTATEVGAIQNMSNSIFGLDAAIFQASFSRSLQKLWQLYLDLGDDEMYYRVQGQQLPRLAKKSEIGRAYDIKAAGTPANTNKNIQLNHLSQAMQLVFNPLVLQSGRVDFAALIERFLRVLDLNLAKSVIRPPEEAAAVQTVLQAGEAATGEKQPPM